MSAINYIINIIIIYTDSLEKKRDKTIYVLCMIESVLLTIMPNIAIRPILWNAVTSPETVLNGYSFEIMLYKTPSPYFIVLDLLGEKNAGQGYWVSQND